MAQFGEVIVSVDVHAELDFLELGGGVALVLFVLGSFVFELAEVDDATDGWLGGGCDFHEVEAQILGVPEGVGEFHDSQLLAVGGQDYPHFACANAAIDSDLIELDRDYRVGWGSVERGVHPVLLFRLIAGPRFW